MSSDRGVDVEQQVAQVNVTDEQWKAFRRACLDDGVPVSDALGRLVETELRKRGRQRSSTSPSRRPSARIEEPRLFVRKPNPASSRAGRHFESNPDRTSERYEPAATPARTLKQALLVAGARRSSHSAPDAKKPRDGRRKLQAVEKFPR